MTMRLIAAALLGLCIGAMAAQPASTPSAKEQPPALRVQLVEDAAGEAHTKEREATTDKHDASDLAAQWLAADSASRQVTIGWVSLALSFIATVAGFTSLIATYKSLAIAREASVSVDRPWLRINLN